MGPLEQHTNRGNLKRCTQHTFFRMDSYRTNRYILKCRLPSIISISKILPLTLNMILAPPVGSTSCKKVRTQECPSRYRKPFSWSGVAVTDPNSQASLGQLGTHHIVHSVASSFPFHPDITFEQFTFSL